MPIILFQYLNNYLLMFYNDNFFKIVYSRYILELFKVIVFSYYDFKFKNFV